MDRVSLSVKRKMEVPDGTKECKNICYPINGSGNDGGERRQCRKRGVEAMGLIVSSRPLTSTYQPTAAGMYKGVSIGVIDVGTHLNELRQAKTHDVCLGWLLFLSEGKSINVWRRFNLTLHPFRAGWLRLEVSLRYQLPSATDTQSIKGWGNTRCR